MLCTVDEYGKNAVYGLRVRLKCCVRLTFTVSENAVFTLYD